MAEAPAPARRPRGRGGRSAGEDGALARERVRQAIRAAIARRTLLPGQQVPEVELAAALGVSRTPVREALRELEQQGLVVSYPHRGAFIRTFTWKRVDDLVHLRAAVEGMAARQAVEQASRAQVRRLEALVDALGTGARADGPDASDGPEEVPAAVVDLEFHETLVVLSGNEELLRVWRWVDPVIRTVLAGELGPDGAAPGARRARLVERHRRIVDALLSGDAARAEHAARDHVVDAGRRLVDDLRRREPPPGDGGPVRVLAHHRDRDGRG